MSDVVPGELRGRAASVRSVVRALSALAPFIVGVLSDATDLLVDQQDVTPLGLAFPAIELQTTEDPLDAALRRVLRAMKV